MTTYSDQQDTERVEQPYGFEPPATSNEYPAEVLQRQRFGGPNWGAGFFGWLVTVAIFGVLATATAVAVLTLGLPEDLRTTEAAGTRGLVTAAALTLLVVMLAYFSGGYVAGRMSRFDGGKQGLAVWVVGLLLTGAAVGLVLLLGPQLELPDRVDLASAQLSQSPTGLTAVVAAAAVMVVGLLAAVLGGKLGCRYHRKVDDAAYV
jgi:hypothetical protein